MALVGLWVDPALHAATTTSLTSAALSRGHLATAIQLADRRCRLALVAGPVDYVLRAELLHRTGDHDAAVADVRTALEIEPDDIFANRKLLAWGTPDERLAAAGILVELDREPPSLLAALAVLRQSGVTAVGRASILDGAIRGWAAWTTPAGAQTIDETSRTILVEHGNTIDRIRLKPDPKHTLASALGCANSFAVATSIAPGQWMGFAAGVGPLRLLPRFSGFAPAAESKPVQPTVRRAAATPAAPDVTVIVPVFADLAATRACLDSLLAAIAGERCAIAILAVDDASPEPGMAEYLAGLPIDVLTLSRNLGFVGAVNAALPRAGESDVVLLNSDTVLPHGAIGRLRAAAQSAPDIGTVTPLSNNGELTSLPVPFRDNPLPDAAELARIDAAAAAAGPDVVELPSGIGFCMYVTSGCLDAVQGLSKMYERGYGEDVHLCLAAREAGLRSVCATDVYVGHAGTRSFGAEKRRLVMRNSARLAARFPAHEREVAAFVAADPLAPARFAIGRALMQGFAGRIVVTDASCAGAATARAEGIAALTPTLLVTRDRHGVRLTMLGGSGGRQATVFALPSENEALTALTGSFVPDRIEVFDPAAAIELGLDRRGVPLDLHLGDFRGVIVRTGERDEDRVEALRRLAAAADSIRAPGSMARAVAVAALGLKARRVAIADGGVRPPVTASGAARLGIVLLDEDANVRRLLRRLGDRLPRSADGQPPVVVLGATADDLHLIGAGGIMISGTVATTEYATVARRYGVTHLFALSEAATFGSPEEQAIEALPLPLARFAWAAPSKPSPSDLWLSPDLDDDAVAAAIAAWLAR